MTQPNRAQPHRAQPHRAQPHRAEVVVDLDAIAANTAVLRERVGRPLMAVVKADGYGHGLVPAARAALAGGADALGVTVLEEALALRAAGVTAPVLSWQHVPGADYAAGLRAGVELSVNAGWALAEVVTAARATGRTAAVQLFVDTGLSREGATPADWPALVADAVRAQADGDVVVTGLWSHLAYADAPTHPTIAAQVAVFEEATELARAAGLADARRHLANSAATTALPHTWYDQVRPGVAIYGLDPLGGDPAAVGLRPAMTVRARVALTKRVPAGTGVSYGHTHHTAAAANLALVPVGYADGVPRAAGNRAQVLAGGARRTIAGRVCMDQFVLDLGDDVVDPGDEVVLWGPGEHGEPTAQDWADALDTIHYELVTRVGGRFTRTYTGTAGVPLVKQPQPRTVGLVGGLLGLAAAGTAVGVAVTRAASSRVRADRVGPVPGALPLPAHEPHDPVEPTDRQAAVQRADDPLDGGSRPADRTALVTASDGVLLNVEEVGPRDAPLTVVLVHGYTLSMASWTFQRRDLGRELATSNGHRPRARLVLYDQRGHGASGRGDAEHSTVDQLADDLLAVLDARAPRGPVVLVGHSMGGMTVLQLAARRPDLFGTRVVGVGLVSTSAGGLEDLDLGLPGVLTRVRGAVFPIAGYVMRHRPTWAEWIRRSAADVVSWATKALSFARPDVDPRLVDYVDAMIAGAPVEVIAEFYPALVGLDASGAIEPLAHVPVLVLSGDEDKLIPQGHSDRVVAELTAAGARDVRYRVVPHAGHLVLLEDPDEVTGAIAELVARVASR